MDALKSGDSLPLRINLDIAKLQESLLYIIFVLPDDIAVRLHPYGTLHLDLCAFTLLLFILSLTALSKTRRNASQISSTPQLNRHLKALSSVVVPSSNARGLSFVPHRLHKRTITLNVADMMHEIACGNIELRNPADDLAALFLDRLRVDDFDIKLDAESLRTKVMVWLMKAHFMRETSKHAPGTPMLSKDPKTLRLDILPHPKSIPAVRAHIRSATSAATLEFTTLSSNVPWMSREFILCALPFLKRCSMPSPLLLSLTSVLDVNASVKTVENVSRQYAALLRSTAQDLEEEPHTRGSCIDQFGITIWYEHRLLLAWEAALLETGLISRWIVVFNGADS